MKNKAKKKVIKPANPLNVFFVLVAISIVVGMVVIILNHHFSFDGKDRPGIEDYDVQVVIDNVKIDDYNKFNLGEEFVISNENTVLGVVSKQPFYAENVIGFFVVFKVKGSYDAENGFMLNGDMYIAPGMRFMIHGNNSTHQMEIHSITKSNNTN